MDANQELSLTEVAKMFATTEEELQRDLEEAHAQIEAGQGIDITEELLAWERSREEKMKQQVEEFLANLLSMGMKPDQIAEKGYEFAVALLQAQEEIGSPLSATTMFRASEQVKNALPGAYRIYDLRNRMHWSPYHVP